MPSLIEFVSSWSELETALLINIPLFGGPLLLAAWLAGRKR